MCGRYTLAPECDEIERAFAADTGPIRDLHHPRHNIAPTTDAPVIIAAGDERRAGPMRWGLVAQPTGPQGKAGAHGNAGPHANVGPETESGPRGRAGPPGNAKARPGRRHINARSETAATRPAFRDAFRRRRCLVPADGFYEWTASPAGKQPWWIHRPGRPLFAMAGIWSWDLPPGQDRRPAFAILTRAAPPSLKHLHHRCPVILPESDWDAWLSRRTPAAEVARIARLTEPPPLHAHRVSRAVNRVQHDEPGCVEPVKPTAAGALLSLEEEMLDGMDSIGAEEGDDQPH